MPVQIAYGSLGGQGPPALLLAEDDIFSQSSDSYLNVGRLHQNVPSLTVNTIQERLSTSCPTCFWCPTGNWCLL